MGRKTYESIGKPLPGRTMIVVTHNRDYEVPEGVLLAESIQDVFQICKERKEDDVYIAGGASIYEQSIKWADRLIVTEVDTVCEGADAFFPYIDDNWYRTHCENWVISETGYRHRLTVYHRV